MVDFIINCILDILYNVSPDVFDYFRSKPVVPIEPPIEFSGEGRFKERWFYKGKPLKHTLVKSFYCSVRRMEMSKHQVALNDYFSEELIYKNIGEAITKGGMLENTRIFKTGDFGPWVHNKSFVMQKMLHEVVIPLDGVSGKCIIITDFFTTFGYC